MIYPWHEEKQSSHLIIAGDCANRIDFTLAFIKEAAHYYEQVYFCDGNHEHYRGYKDGRTVAENMATLNQFAEKWRWPKNGEKQLNVFFMDGTQKIIYDHTAFIGACGWYDWVFGLGDREYQHYNWKHGMNDRRCIRFDKYPDKYAIEHADRLAELVKMYNEAEEDDPNYVKEIIMFTHTVPCKAGIYRGPNMDWQELNGSYGNRLMAKVVAADTKNKIKVWCFGHTHIRHDFTDGHIRYVANPRGYAGEGRDGRAYEGLVQIDTEAPESAFGAIER